MKKMLVEAELGNYRRPSPSPTAALPETKKPPIKSLRVGV